MNATTVRLSIPPVYCHVCRAQVLLTDAIGRWTSPAYVVPLAPDVTTLACVWDARRVADPSTVVPLAPDMAAGVPGCAPALPARDVFDLLVALGASLGDPDPPVPSWRAGG